MATRMGDSQPAFSSGLPTDWPEWNKQREAVMNQRTVGTVTPSLTLKEVAETTVRSAMVGGLGCGALFLTSFILPINPGTKTYLSTFFGLGGLFFALERHAILWFKQKDTAQSEVQRLLETYDERAGNKLDLIAQLRSAIQENQFSVDDLDSLTQLNLPTDITSELQQLSENLKALAPAVQDSLTVLQQHNCANDRYFNYLLPYIQQGNREGYCAKGGSKTREEREAIYDAAARFLEMGPQIDKAIKAFQSKLLAALNVAEQSVDDEYQQLEREKELLTSRPATQD